MTILGIDYGSQRVGIALSDSGEVLAFPHVIFENTKVLLEDIQDLCAQKSVRMIIVGKSQDFRGNDNPIMERIRAFKTQIEKETGLPVLFQEEYLTSEEARRFQGNSMHVDASAAALILQRFLDRQRASKHIADNKKVRASAIVIDRDRILLIRRVKPEIEYYTLPGGTLEKGEKIDQTLDREVKEELGFEVKAKRHLFTVESEGRDDHYFVIEHYEGILKLGGPEAQRMSSENQYHFEWKTFRELQQMTNFYPTPKDAKERIISLWERGEL